MTRIAVTGIDALRRLSDEPLRSALRNNEAAAALERGGI